MKSTKQIHDIDDDADNDGDSDNSDNNNDDASTLAAIKRRNRDDRKTARSLGSHAEKDKKAAVVLEPEKSKDNKQSLTLLRARRRRRSMTERDDSSAFNGAQDDNNTATRRQIDTASGIVESFGEQVSEKNNFCDRQQVINPRGQPVVDSLLLTPYLLLKNGFNLLKPNNQKYNINEVLNSSSEEISEVELSDLCNSLNNRQQSPNMPKKNTYQALNGKDAGGANNKNAISDRRQSKESRRLIDTNDYSRLKQFRPKKQSTLNEFKRLLLLAIIITVVGLLLWQVYEVLIEDEHNYLGVVESPAILGKYKQYAVSTDATHCAKVGNSLLAKGGSAIDAAIGTLLCMGATGPNSSGLGGGCLMTIYQRKDKKATVIDGREMAPDYATEDMFVNKSKIASSRGALSVGVPGELAAYWEAHQRFGKLKWSELFDQTIDMAENGIPVSNHLAHALHTPMHVQYLTEPMKKIFRNNKTGELLQEGEILVQKALANSLRRLRDNGVKEFYGGETGKLFIKDLKEQGGQMTLENLQQYKALVKEPLVFKLADDLTLHTQPLPGSGIVLSVILRIMKELGYYKNLIPQDSLESASRYYHRLAEAFKFAFGQRGGLEDKPENVTRLEELMAKLSSDSYIKEVASKIDNKTHDPAYYGAMEYFAIDHGTAHVSVMDSEGNAVAITTSVNLYFGSGQISPSTGIVYNDVMDDFVSPNITNKFGLSPSKYNRIRPGRRPLSSMAPSVFTDSEGNVKLIIGASGGSKITTAIAGVSLRHCFLGEDIKTAIDGPRIHHQFLPNKIIHEHEFPKTILHLLEQVYGHKTETFVGRSSVVIGVASQPGLNKTSRIITANSDHRKGGSVGGV